MKVVFTEQSLGSLQEALLFLLNELELPKNQVIKIKNQLLSKAENLAFHPYVGQKEEYLEHLGEDHRRMVEGCFNGNLIFTFKSFTRNGKIYLEDEESEDEVNVFHYTVQEESMLWEDQEGESLIWKRLTLP